MVRVEVGIPGETRRGVLTAEAIALLQDGGNVAGAALMQALRTGDYAALRALPPQDADLTDKPVEETELFAGSIPLTRYRTASGPAAAIP